jgi:acyl-CoA thioesterase FadM
MRGHVLPCDMDFNLHMNNAVYNAYTDISRIGWFTRLLHGHASWYRKEGFIANGGLSFFFLREMRFMQAYELRTRAVGCDAKWVYLRHEYRDPGRKGTVFAVGMAKIVFKERGGRTLVPADFFRKLGFAIPAGSTAPGTAGFQVGTHVAGLLHSVLEELQPGAAAGGAGVAPKHATQDGRQSAAGADADTTPSSHSPCSNSSAGGRRKVR